MPLGTVETANTLTGLETSREPIAASAPTTLHDTSEEPIAALDKPTAALEEPIDKSAHASSRGALEKPITESITAPSLDKVRLLHPSRLYLLAF